MTIYKFKPDDAYRFASEQHIRTRDRGDELQFVSCPYCRAGIERGQDRWTFSINLKNGRFNCLRGSCGAKGNMITLHKDFNFSLGQDADNYFDGLTKFRNIHRKKKAEVKPAAVAYMESRGISEAVTRQYGITTQTDNDKALVFPFEDANGILRFVKYRKTDFQKGRDNSKEWCERDCMPILFGMAQCDPECKTLVMTEGQIDSLSVAEAGIKNAVSVPTGKNGFTWIPYCWDFLCGFDELIVFGDYERGEITLLADMAQRFNGTVRHVRPEDYMGCKDANELLMKYGPEAVRAAVNNAVCPPINEIISLDEVKRADMSQLENIRTSIPALDRMLGGFYMGQLILITGERGDGKSTMASQFASIALAQDYSVFFYSGELLDWYFKAWFDLQCAGPDHINGVQTAYGSISYSVEANALNMIEKWYKGRLFLYRNDVQKEEEHAGLLDVMERSIRQYGCRVLFLDNLMTAMSDDLSVDIYRQQTVFVKRLAAMAKDMNVLIFLIAHPRKGNGYSFSNDDVAGSSNITNLVDVNLRYARPKDTEDPEQPDRILQVLKNRLNGRTHRNDDGIKLYYSESSKRISETAGAFSWQMGWEKDDFMDADADSEELPF